MKRTSKLAGLMLALAAGAALAQDQPAPEPDREPLPAAPREVLVRMLDQAIPRWDEGVLVHPDTPDWTEKLDLQTAASLDEAAEKIVKAIA